MECVTQCKKLPLGKPLTLLTYRFQNQMKISSCLFDPECHKCKQSPLLPHIDLNKCIDAGWDAHWQSIGVTCQIIRHKRKSAVCVWQRNSLTQKSLLSNVPRRSLLYKGSHTLLSVTCGDDLKRGQILQQDNSEATDDLTTDSIST